MSTSSFLIGPMSYLITVRGGVYEPSCNQPSGGSIDVLASPLGTLLLSIFISSRWWRPKQSKKDNDE